MKWSAALGAVVVVAGSVVASACANGDTSVDTGGDPGNGADTSMGNPSSSDSGGNPYAYDATAGGYDATAPTSGNDATMPSSGDSAPPGFQSDSGPPVSVDAGLAPGVCDPNNPKYLIELISGAPPPCPPSPGTCPAGQCCFSGIACLTQ